MPRYIMIFNKSDDIVLRKELLPDISLDELKNIFKYSDNDPEFISVYDIDLEQSKALSQYTEFDFDFEKYDYQLSYRTSE